MATTELCWWPLSAWISPAAALFVFFNVLVGAVAIMSREQPGGGPVSRRRLCRSASSMVFDRLRSFSMFSVHHAAEYSYHTSQEADEQQASTSTPEHPVPEPAAAEPQSAPAQALAADADLLSQTHKDEAESEEKSTSSDDANEQDQDQQHHAPESLSPPAPAAAADEATAAAVERPGKKKPRNKVAAKRSKPRARASGREAEEAPKAKAELNARAELFIRQFREDLKLQRLNSIINNARALDHCGGGAAPEQN